MRQSGNLKTNLNKIEETVLRCNKQAMELMNAEDYSESVKLLLKTNQILMNLTPTFAVIKLKAMTLNNLGCVYKRGGESYKALQHLTQALEYEKRLPEEYTNIAGTHLNLCAIRSHLNDHNAALDHALAAVNIIQRNYTGKVELVTTLVAAYYNAGVEYEFLNRKIEAGNFFRQGFDLGVKHLGRNHTLTVSIEAMLPKKIESAVFSSPRVEKKRKMETVYQSESRIFEDSLEKIAVDTTPWPNFTEKQSWTRGELALQSELTPKPVPRYPKQVRSEAENPISHFPRLPQQGNVNLPDFSSDTTPKISIKQPQNYSPQKPLISSRQSLNNSLTDRKKNFNKNLHQHELSAKPKPANLHLHHHEHTLVKELPKKNEHPPQLRQNFRIATKPQPKSTRSLNSNPSKSTVSEQSLTSKRNPSLNVFNYSITSEKIDELSSKLENLQEKLNHFEANYQKMKTLDEVQDDESVVSTVTVVSHKRHKAAILIQKHFRRFKAQKRFREMKDAVIKIQSVNRGMATRRKMRKNLLKSEDFSQQCTLELIQTPISVKNEEKGNQTEWVLKNKLERQIVLVSKQGVKACKKKKTVLGYITLLQAVFRGFLARRERKKKMKAIKIIQRKMISVRIRSIYLKVVSAIVFIQAVYRGYRTRKFVKTILPRDVVAFVQSVKRW